DKIRADHQSESGEADRTDDSAERAGESGQGDQVKRGPSEERRVERAGKTMKTKITVLTLCAMLRSLCFPAEAQQVGKVFRIGFLDSSTASGSAVLVDAFRQELSKLGWTEAKNITIEYRFAEGKFERLAELAADLVRLKVDLIVITSTQPALAAKK